MTYSQLHAWFLLLTARIESYTHTKNYPTCGHPLLASLYTHAWISFHFHFHPKCRFLRSPQTPGTMPEDQVTHLHPRAQIRVQDPVFWWGSHNALTTLSTTHTVRTSPHERPAMNPHSSGKKFNFNRISQGKSNPYARRNCEHKASVTLTCKIQ